MNQRTPNHQKVLFVKISLSFTSLIPCLKTPSDDRENTEKTPTQLPASKKALFLRLLPKKVVCIPKKVDSFPEKVYSFPETVDLSVFKQKTPKKAIFLAYLEKKVYLCQNNLVNNNTMTSIRQFQRYIWLVDLLYSRGALTRQQINDYWQNAALNDEDEATIPRRTFFRMKDDILILFGIEIECVSGNKYAIANRDDIKSDDVQNWLLNSFSVSNLLMEGQQLRDRLLLEDIPSGNKYLTQVIDAMRQNLTLQVEYQSFKMTAPRNFEIAPYCIKVFKQRWYIIGLREGNDELHFYSLDRVLSMQITENAFKVPKSFNADAFLHNYYGVMAGTMPAESVLLRVTPFRANYLRSLPLHHSQNEVERTDEYSLFEYWIAPTADFIQELRSFLPDIIVLRPLWLREKFIQEAKNILDNYKKMN